jgi:hypothetical protein
MRALVLLPTMVLGLGLLLAGCSDRPNVGASCTAMEGCDDGLTCELSVAGGYCTRSCTSAGSEDQCPEGSVCDNLSGLALTCVRICQLQTDCRPEYECNGTTNASVKVCKIKL